MALVGVQRDPYNLSVQRCNDLQIIRRLDEYWNPHGAVSDYGEFAWNVVSVVVMRIHNCGWKRHLKLTSLWSSPCTI